MGKKILEKQLRKNGLMFIIVGGLLSLFFLFMILILIIGGIVEGALIFGLLLVAPIVMLYFGIDYMKGVNSRKIKKNPKIIELVNDLYDHTIFENDFVIISERAIAPKNLVIRVSARTDILGIYENIQRVNGIVTSHMIILEKRDGLPISINVYAKKQQTKDNLLLTISNYCPNAKVGYTSEMLNYVKEERKKYKESLKNMK